MAGDLDVNQHNVLNVERAGVKTGMVTMRRLGLRCHLHSVDCLMVSFNNISCWCT